jgi:hypothetical protein
LSSRYFLLILQLKPKYPEHSTALHEYWHGLPIPAAGGRRSCRRGQRAAVGPACILAPLPARGKAPGGGRSCRRAARLHSGTPGFRGRRPHFPFLIFLIFLFLAGFSVDNMPLLVYYREIKY